MRWRVVCGFSETMEIFCPTRALSSVDFPELGRPMRVIIPDFMSDSEIAGTREARSKQRGKAKVKRKMAKIFLSGAGRLLLSSSVFSFLLFPFNFFIRVLRASVVNYFSDGARCPRTASEA